MTDTAQKLQEVHNEMMDLMGWEEGETWQWMGQPMEELDMHSPASLIIDGKTQVLDGFIAGMKRVMIK